MRPAAEALPLRILGEQFSKCNREHPPASGRSGVAFQEFPMRRTNFAVQTGFEHGREDVLSPRPAVKVDRVLLENKQKRGELEALPLMLKLLLD
jgi:hypothetical protein